jgi:hypothetical protein
MTSIAQHIKRFVLIAAVGAFAAGMTPITAAPVEAKTKTQVKNENKAKAYKATQASKKAAKASKKK